MERVTEKKKKKEHWYQEALTLYSGYCQSCPSLIIERHVIFINLQFYKICSREMTFLPLPFWNVNKSESGRKMYLTLLFRNVSICVPGKHMASFLRLPAMHTYLKMQSGESKVWLLLKMFRNLSDSWRTVLQEEITKALEQSTICYMSELLMIWILHLYFQRSNEVSR